MAADYLSDLPRLIAHRGASTYAPENTLAALRKAAEMGAEWVECDVMLDSRHQPIIFHDVRLHRTTNGRGLVSKTPYSVIAQLDAGSWFKPEFTNEPVPTLAEWLQTAAELKLGINLEIKANKANVALLADSVITHLAHFWGAGQTAPIISSSNQDCLSAIYKRAPYFLLAYISDRWPTRWKKTLARYNCFSFHVNHLILNEERVRAVKDHDYLVLAYTVNNHRRANELFNMGVDAIFSDDPLLLCSLSP